ncbi:type 2 lantipeptide synthetase LanM family protein [Pendulispora rubella]|uniref:Type 2 lantipeptide synthetase LanM family protein n=1 Tax=Pendulispora rubella TaxID=2741070 RepID=A0ABZ2KZC2_9BACT
MDHQDRDRSNSASTHHERDARAGFFVRATLLPELRRAWSDSAAGDLLQEVTPEQVGDVVRAWQDAIPLDDAAFDERLDAEGLGRVAFGQLLALREQIAARMKEPWHDTLGAVLDRIGQPMGLEPAWSELGPFAEVLDGFVAVGWESVRKRAPSCEAAFDIAWDAIAKGLQNQLRERLLWLASRTLVLELNVARLQERLEGDTPEARCRYYTETLLRGRDEWERLFDEYQGLARLLCTTCLRWADAVSEVLGHLAEDFPRIQPMLLHRPQTRLALVELEGGISDPHRDGRGVWKVALAAGAKTKERLVYKPRSLAVDAHFQQLLGFCNEGARKGELRLSDLRHGALQHTGPDFPEMPILGVLDCGDHGWMEHVERGDCPNDAAAERFYVRQGGYLALLHVLDAVDFHYQNLIARGEHPVLVDLESLFHPALPSPPSDNEAYSLGYVRLLHSVIGTGLLPGRMWGNDVNAGINIGGMGDGDARVAPQASRMLQDIGTDTMRVVEGPNPTLPLGDNVPRVAGAVARLTQHTEALVAGLEAMLRFLGARAAELLASGGAIAAFANDPVRHIVRGTAVYLRLLGGARHPDRLRDLLERERLFELLWRVTASPTLRRLIPFEKEDLRLGDVPYFTARPDSRDLWSSRGHRVADVFPRGALDDVGARLRGLDDGEIDAQVFITRGAISAVYPDGPIHWPVESRARSRAQDSAARALEMAWRIGESLSKSAIRGPRSATWLGMDPVTGESSFRLAPIGPDLYGGTAGVALFLAYLGAIAHEERFTRLAEQAAHATRTALEESAMLRPAGGFIGAMSGLYALVLLRKCWHDDAQLPRAATLHGLLDGVEEALGRDTKLDVMHGAAGAILALLTLHEATSEPRALDVAVTAGRHLGRHAVRTAAGTAWNTGTGRRMLLGFSHGAAGIACALFRLAATLRRHAILADDAAVFDELSQGALSFERAHFDVSAGNWPDLRDEVGDRFMLAWCHGAPGIALSRLGILAGAPDATARTEVETAVKTVLASPARENHVLCHGELGNLMILRHAANVLDRPNWHVAIEQRLDASLAVESSLGPRCGFSSPAAAPSLMAGIAGIGYGLLHLTRPDVVPRMLDLSSPK